jgi:hypothetical protein
MIEGLPDDLTPVQLSTEYRALGYPRAAWVAGKKRPKGVVAAGDVDLTTDTGSSFADPGGLPGAEEDGLVQLIEGGGAGAAGRQGQEGGERRAPRRGVPCPSRPPERDLHRPLCGHDNRPVARSGTGRRERRTGPPKISLWRSTRSGRRASGDRSARSQRGSAPGWWWRRNGRAKAAIVAARVGDGADNAADTGRVCHARHPARRAAAIVAWRDAAALVAGFDLSLLATDVTVAAHSRGDDRG